MIEPARIAELARSCLGTPFRHQARVPGVGIDCAGLLVHVLDGLGLPYIDERGYPHRPHNNLIRSILDSQPSLQPVRRSEMQAGDVLLMHLENPQPNHVAIYTGETIVHAYFRSAKVVEHRLDNKWRSIIVAVYRIVRPADGG